jgi:ribonuclease HI
VPDGPCGNGGAEQTTNQRMELEAVLRAVESLPGPLRIHSDSTYVVNCFNDRWYEGWLSRGWKNSQKKPVANRDLWEPLVAAYLERADEIEFIWVKGHAGNRWNERADELAVAAAEAVVADLAESAAAPGKASVAAPWPAGQALWVSGTATPSDDQVLALERAIDGLTPGSDILITGLRRGVELIAGEKARARRIEIGVVLPFDEPAAKWPLRDRQRFDSIRSAAAFEIVLGGDPAAPGAAVAQRNDWVLDHVIGVIAVADPEVAEVAEERGLTVIAVD